MSEWTEEAAYRFVRSAMQVFPGSREEGTLTEEEIAGYLARNGYGHLEESYVCRASKLDGQRCSNRRRAGSAFCGVHRR
jgi:hypothetical protein